MKHTKTLDWPSLLLLVAILFGGLVRFMPALMTHFPLNDGGMFYDMTRDLQANHYLLPATTHYNGLNLPYAYPPFGFYAASLLSDLLRIPLLDLFLWLPALVAAFSIPAFYLLAHALLPDDLHAALAALFFALTPGGYDWPVMGGGVTRAFGLLFMMLALYFVLRLFQTGAWKNSFPAILFSAFAVLSHPEVGIQTAGACIVLWLFYGRSWRGVLQAFLVGIGVALVTAPWWGTVIAANGLAPFLSAIQTGEHSSVSWLSLLAGLFTTSEFLPILLILRLAGLFYAVWKRQFIFIALIFVPALVDPRSAATVSYLVLSMLSAYAFLDVWPFIVKKLRGVEVPPFLAQRGGTIALFGLLFFLFLECGLNNYRLINTTLTAASRQAMTWVKQNIPAGENFYLITTAPYSMSDPVQEWFPTLTGQHSQTTLQGLEWSLGGNFNTRLNDLVELQTCADLACVEAWSAHTGLDFDAIWVSVYSLRANPQKAAQTTSLVASIQASNQFTQVYEGQSSSAGKIMIFERLKK